MPKNKSKARNKGFEVVAKEKIHEGVEELKKILTDAKAKFDKTDENTKQKIVAGVAGSIALIAGAIGISRMSKMRKNKGKK